MFLNKSLVGNSLRKSLKTIIKIQNREIHNRSLIGNRDWVAFGRSGNAYYSDRIDYPFPAIRFKENSNELLALREKEKGDWRKLTIEEKKILYRASFCQTFSEILAPNGEWKSIIGWTLFFVSLGLWSAYAVKFFMYGPMPESFSESSRRHQLRRILDLRMGHLTGISTKWDYENDDWKK